MATYGWYSLNTSSTPYTWSPTGNWNNGADWANLASTTFPPATGTVPGLGDTAYIVSANSLFAPPFPFPPPPYNVDITVNTAVQPIATLGLGKFEFIASASQPIIDIVGVSFSVTGSIVDQFTATFPSPIGTRHFSGGGIIDLASSASLEVGTTIDPNITIHFADNSSDTVILDGVSSVLPTAAQGQFTGFQAGNIIDLPNVLFFGAAPSAYNAVTGLLTISTGAVTDAALFLPGFSSVADFSLVHDSGTGLAIVTCFVEGTRIRTPSGEIAVEALREGDLVTIRDPQTAADQVQPIRWIGRRRINLRRHRQPDLASPIRIRRNACAEGIPQRDLLVSPDHAVFLDDVLVPARLLVNGATITQETDLRAVQYFHIELDRHAILLAEGLPAESYLDTGNRALFENSGQPTILHPDFIPDATHLSWSQDACAELAVEPSQIEPIWRRLAVRAAALGFPASEVASLSNDATPWLEVNGQTVRATTIRPGHYLFALPAHLHQQPVTLRSNATRPSDRTPWLDDRRRLGIAVERILLHGQTEVTELALDHPVLATGWWQAERDADRIWRWTDGNAAFPVREDTQMIEIRTTGAQPAALNIARAA